MRPDEAPIFFVDASLGRRIVPEALRNVGVQVIAHGERFEPGTPDAVWLREAGRQGWIVLTKDKRIRYRENEQRALREAGVAVFVFVGKNLTGEEIARALVAALPRMLRAVRRARRPFIATVTATGSVRLLP